MEKKAVKRGNSLVRGGGVAVVLCAAISASIAVPACSTEFTDCTATYTCAAGGTGGTGGTTLLGESGANAEGGAKNGSSGAPDSAAGASGASDAAAGASGSTNSTAGASNEGGAAGAPAQCTPTQTRPCSEDGALGPCGAGIETCGSDGNWGACSLKPAAKDTCEPNNDASCNGIANEGCPCLAGKTRKCSDAGALGACSVGTQTCGNDGTWGGCSIAPSADTCVAGNDNSCNGVPNEGCSCINGVTKRACGACSDGSQTCTDGKTNTYGACTGAVKVAVTYYRDADGDGFGSAATTTSCNGPPAGFTDQTGDCCDDGGNIAIAKTIFPGQTQYFTSSTTVCNIGWNYNCSPGGSIETNPATMTNGCASDATYPSCAIGSGPVSTTNCGVKIVPCQCSDISTPTITYCRPTCVGEEVLIGCH